MMQFIQKYFVNKIKEKKGQNSVEFMLMLGTIVSLVVSFFALFHTKLAGIFFFLIGEILG
ncbi:uncharacterized protein (UPF0333 family) [Elusimicrobium posterum]|uniref:hypothetical protein n=1 Tax=Elusimicrobium posterum TaxID=3116653 RepID=UPI003C746B69